MVGQNPAGESTERAIRPPARWQGVILVSFAIDEKNRSRLLSKGRPGKEDERGATWRGVDLTRAQLRSTLRPRRISPRW